MRLRKKGMHWDKTQKEMKARKKARHSQTLRVKMLRWKQREK